MLNEKKEGGQKILEKDLKVENLFLKRELEKVKPRPVVDVNLKDPGPTDSENRKLYVAQVAGFHKDVMGHKLLHLIAESRSQFEQIDRNTYGYSQEQFDLILKGTINALWLIYSWGEDMINEQISNQQEEFENLTDEEKQRLKDKLN